MEGTLEVALPLRPVNSREVDENVKPSGTRTSSYNLIITE